MFFWCAVAVLAFLFYIWATLNNDFFEKLGIPYVKPYFLIGSSTDLFYDRKSFPDLILKFYNQLKHEKIIGQFEFRTPIFLIRDPKLAKHITIKNFEHFPDHRLYMDESIDPLLGKCLLALRQQKWKDMRATLSPMFTGSKMRQMHKLIAEVGYQSSKTLLENFKKGDENVLDFKPLALKITVDVIATTAFGIEVNSFADPDNDFQRVAKKISDFQSFKGIIKFLTCMLFTSVARFLKISMFGEEVNKFFQETVKEVMKVRGEKGIIRHDMIDLLMQAKKGSLKHENEENENEGFATVEECDVGKVQVKRVWDDDDLIAQCLLFFIAGSEPLSTMLSFMSYELMANQDIQTKLFEEVKTMEDELDGKRISYDQMQSLKYMDQFVCEVLRMWPGMAMSDRVCNKDFPLEWDGRKFTITEGRIIVIPIHGYHFDPEYFPNPEKFDPERFNEENRKNIDPDTYLPFGIGPRNCIGSRFALMEVKTIFYYLLLNFSFEVSEKSQIPIKLKKIPVGLKPEKGFWVELRPRN